MSNIEENKSALDYLDREDLKALLPHREPMLLIDGAMVLEDNSAEGFYDVVGNEWFLQGHFPDKPVVPGVILCEMMAQTCCVLIGDDEAFKGKKITPYFTGLDKVKFRNPVLPGDKFEINCKIIKRKGNFFFAEGIGEVEGKRCVSASFSFAIIIEE